MATDVAVATFTGKLKKYTSVGVLSGPPPIPKKLDINPKIMLTLVAIGSINMYMYFSPDIELISLLVF